MKTRYFIHPENNRFWCSTLDGATVHVKHGLVGGALTETSETFLGKNQGKANELSPSEDAASRMEYNVDKKIREGYQEFKKIGNEFKPLSGSITINKVDLDNLPENFCVYKPKQELTAGMEKKIKAGKVLYALKRNGMAYFIAKGPTGKVQMYSRRMFKQHNKEKKTKYTWNDRFPWLVEEADKVMPNNSLIAGELVVPNVVGYKDSQKAMQKIEKSLTPEALELQKEDKNRARMYCWDVVFWDGEPLAVERPVKERYSLIHEKFLTQKHFIPITYWTTDQFVDTESALKFAKEEKLEGFVVVDPDGVYGEDAYNFKGKPDRPGQYCCKLKPEYEADVVVEWDPENKIGHASTKDKFNDGKPGIKSVAMFQYRPDGTKVYLSDLGVGITDKLRVALADPALFPQVWRVYYTDRRFMGLGDDTNAMDFVRVKTEEPDWVRWTKADGGDKTPEECIDDRI